MDFLQKWGLDQAEAVVIGQSIKDLKTNDLIVFHAEQSLDLKISDPQIDTYINDNGYATKARFIFFGKKYAGKHKLSNFANSRATLIDNIRKVILFT